MFVPFKRIVLFVLTALFLVSCLVNSGDEHLALNSAPTGNFSKLQTPIICAYLHIGNRKLDLNSLRLDGVNILNLAFTKITNNRIGLLRPEDAQNFMIAKKLKKLYPKMKILVSVGGYGTSKVFSDMSLSASSRSVFVDDAIRFVRYYGLDGVDVDWEFPGMNAQTRDTDRVNFTSLLTELRTAFDKASKQDGKKYYLTVAAGAFDMYLTYTEIRKIEPLTDYFFVMTYDFFGQWNKITGHHTNLYFSSLKHNGHSVDKVVKNYYKAGVPKEKIIIGAAFYGRKWKNVEAVNSGLFCKGTGVGSVAFRQIPPLLKSGKYIRSWDSSALSPTLYNPQDKIFLSYEDMQSVKRKVDYIFIHDLGGIMYWEYFSDYDYMLSKSIKEEFEIHRGGYPRISFPGKK